MNFPETVLPYRNFYANYEFLGDLFYFSIFTEYNSSFFFASIASAEQTEILFHVVGIRSETYFLHTQSFLIETKNKRYFISINGKQKQMKFTNNECYL